MAAWIASCSLSILFGVPIHYFAAGIIMFWALALATLLSAFFGFKPPHRYFVASAVMVVVAAYVYFCRIFVHTIPHVWRQ
jgi:hypothetical protein